MERQRFLKYLKQPETLDLAACEELRAMLQKYPYLGVVKAMIAIATNNESDNDAYAEIQEAAVNVPDRELFRKILLRAKQKCIVSQETQHYDNVVIEEQELDEHTNLKGRGSVISEKMFIIPEIDLSSTHEELSAEMAYLEEKRKSLDELKEMIAARLRELEAERQGVVDDENKEKKLTKKEIIEKFIAENPSISRPKAEFFNPISVAQNSITDQEEIVSETLAGIYIKQGHKEKAISVYKKLSLKYPEKSVYFAGLIEALKKEVKQ